MRQPTMHKSVLVTGGAKRLGAELVQAFAQAGWTVWCHYQQSNSEAVALQQQLSQQGFAIELVQANLAHEADIEAMMAAILQRQGPLTAVVNNASLFEPDEGATFSAATARAQFEVNLIAPMLLGKLLAQQQVAAGLSDGCVIHVLDQKVYNLNPDYFSYTLSKLALERAVALQAQALAPVVRVCGVAPGLMYLSGPQQAENFRRASQVNLRRQATDPRDVAKSCLFMAETPSITGATLCVDNGQHLVPLNRDVMFVVDDWLKANTA
jgi:NAD(P)-dependent dehydrogenase (short-subunit alcohol dehydrogenase family)